MFQHLPFCPLAVQTAFGSNVKILYDLMLYALPWTFHYSTFQWMNNTVAIEPTALEPKPQNFFWKINWMLNENELFISGWMLNENGWILMGFG